MRPETISDGMPAVEAACEGVLLAPVALVLAIMSAVASVMSGFGHRFGWWSFSVGFSVLAGAAVLAVVASVSGLAALIRTGTGPRAGRRAKAMAIVSLAVSLPVFAVPLHWIYLARFLPPIHDITTDTRDPPEFVAILPLRRSAPDSSTYGGPRIAALQKRAYPDIRPAVLPVLPAEAFEAALHVARSLGWRIVAAVPQDGRIEATDTTFWFGFVDDIVVRVRPVAGGARIDLRSTSRVGISDLGTNARRIRVFLKALRARS
ncbi:MAG: DUF1499 domain-containing protein [Acidiferrobacterales bacterium]